MNTNKKKYIKLFNENNKLKNILLKSIYLFTISF